MKGKVLLYVVVVLVGVSFWMAFRKDPHDRALQSRELAARVLGEELARQYPGTAALVISNPFARERNLRKDISAVEDAGTRGLRQGFGDKIRIEAVVYPPIRPEAEQDPRAVRIPDTTTPLSYLIAEDAFDQLSEAHPESQVLVSLIGLPARLGKVALWDRAGPPHLGLLFPDLRMIDGAEQLIKAVKSGKIAAFVLPKPGAPPEQTPLRADAQTEFNNRYFLVTDANLKEILDAHPRLFNLGRGER